MGLCQFGSAVAAGRAQHLRRRNPLSAQDALPDRLWQPMTERTPSNASGQEIFRADAALTEGLTQYLGSQR